MKRLRVLVLLHEDLIPPDTIEGVSDKEMAKWKTEYDVIAGLSNIGHDVRPLGVASDLGVIRDTIVEWKPHICFNLLEEFHGVGLYDQHVVSFLELMKIPYTGCNPRGLMIAHDKALSKKILSYHRIAVPDFAVFPRRKVVRRPKRLQFPLLVKSATEDASLGISQASIVSNDEKLNDRIAFVHEQVGTDALVEEYIEGRELYVGIIGNRRLQTFPIWEMDFTNMPDGVAHRHGQSEVGPQVSRQARYNDAQREKPATRPRRVATKALQAHLSHLGNERLCPLGLSATRRRRQAFRARSQSQSQPGLWRGSGRVGR